MPFLPITEILAILCRAIFFHFCEKSRNCFIVCSFVIYMERRAYILYYTNLENLLFNCISDVLNSFFQKVSAFFFRMYLHEEYRNLPFRLKKARKMEDVKRNRDVTCTGY